MAVSCAMSELSAESGRDIRYSARAGFTGLTVGRARGYVQANLAVIPAKFAADFEAYCHANPQACPLLGMSEAGSPAMPDLGQDIDLRTDLPGYLVHQEGSVRPTADITDVWQNDLVAFAIGCWFGAEAALAAAGIRLRHVELGIQGPLFRTNRATIASGPFHGPLVVSMRPFANADATAVKAITGRLPRSHGAPIHEGDPDALGVATPDAPDWGEPLLPLPGETALFWACGLTALAALQSAGLPFFITHAPGKMLVTDLREREFQ
jgi:uncharacterized protein YcsI (UPF0317 family)